MTDDVDSKASAVSKLRRELEEADKRYLSALDNTGQRSAVIAALRAILAFASSAGVKSMPLFVLQDALMQLDDGSTAPILRHNPKSGRSPTGPLRQILQGQAVAVVRALTECGVPLPTARQKVAKTLAAAGVPNLRNSTKPITGRTIREWTDVIAASPQSAAARASRRFPSFRHCEHGGDEITFLLSYVETVARRFAKKPVKGYS